MGDTTCEKIGDLMAANGGRLLGLYVEPCNLFDPSTQSENEDFGSRSTEIFEAVSQ